MNHEQGGVGTPEQPETNSELVGFHDLVDLAMGRFRDAINLQTDNPNFTMVQLGLDYGKDPVSYICLTVDYDDAYRRRGEIVEIGIPLAMAAITEPATKYYPGDPTNYIVGVRYTPEGRQTFTIDLPAFERAKTSDDPESVYIAGLAAKLAPSSGYQLMPRHMDVVTQYFLEVEEEKPERGELPEE